MVFLYSFNFYEKILSANSENHDQIPHYVVSDLGLHYLPMFIISDTGLIGVIKFHRSAEARLSLSLLV